VDNTLNCNTYNATTPTSGAMTIGNNATTTSISIGNSQTTGDLNIGCGTSRTGTIKIGEGINGAQVSIGLDSLVANNVVIGTAGKTISFLRGTTANICDNGGNINIGSSGSTTTVGGKLTVNDQIAYGYTTNPTLTSTSVGYSVNYSWGSGSVSAGTSLTVASFTDQPIGIYLLTVGPTTNYDFSSGERLDITFTSTAGYSSLTSFTGMEHGGNLTEKFGVCFSMPVKVTTTTNQLTVIFNANIGAFSTTGGTSALTRIA
jgi:hypothetical protein